MKYFTMEDLIFANETAVIRNYNRQLSEKIYELPPETKFPIIFSMLHEHAALKKVAPHVRCQIVVDKLGNTAFIDCDIELFNRLPEITKE